MKKETKRRLILYGFLFACIFMTMVACGKNTDGKDEETQTEESSQDSVDVQQPLFLIVKNDMLEEALTLYSYVTGLEHYYDYSIATQFKDKYGVFSHAGEFTPGRVVTIGERDQNGILKEVQLSDDVWEYEKIRRFSVDELGEVLQIADTKYSLREKVYVFSNGERVRLADLSEEDILTVVGMDRKILSINVTTGHGTLVLRNTSLFEESFLQLNNDIFTIITESMELDVPEGTYTLKVANDGWGGTTQIEIIRGEKTEIDLDTLKGEGKKKGIVRFEIDAEEVEVYVDNEKVDHTQPVEITFGMHVLKIKASGYDTWQKRLSVNSEDATISIELEEAQTSTPKEETEEEMEEEMEEETEEEMEEEMEAETETTETEEFIETTESEN